MSAIRSLLAIKAETSKRSLEEFHVYLASATAEPQMAKAGAAKSYKISIELINIY
jgi:hypothetical protein